MKRPLAVVGFTVFFMLMLLPELASWVVFVVLEIALAAAVSIMFIAQKNSKKCGRQSASTTYATFAATSLAVVAACVLSWAGQVELDAPAEQYVDKTVEVMAQIQEISAPRYGRYYAICKAKTIDGKATSFRFRIALRSPLIGAEGDTLSARLTFFAYQNPAKRVCLGSYPSYGSEIFTEPGAPGLSTWIYGMRGKLLGAMDEYLPNEYGAMARGLMLGEISGLSAQTNTAFRTLGLSHLIAVSGQHLAIWCVAILAPLFALLRAKKRTQASIISLFVLLFMALTGFTDSIVRSGLMLLLTQAGTLFNRRADALNSLGFAVLLICVFSPGAAQGLGLQLSFMATLGLLMASSKKRETDITTNTGSLENKRLPRTFSKVFVFIRETAKCTLFATLFTLPITLHVTGRLGLLSVPANIIFAVPAGISMITSGLCAIFSLIPGLNLLSAPLAVICGLCCKFMIGAAKALARVPFVSLPARGNGMAIWISGVLMICGLVVLLIYLHEGKIKALSVRDKRKKAGIFTRQLLNTATLLCAALLMSAQAADLGALRSGTSFTMADTGGVCVVITRGSQTMLIGADGDDFNATGAILDTLEKSGNHELDVILSGSSKIESENLAAVLADFPARHVYIQDVDPGYPLPPSHAATELAYGQRLEWAPGVSIDYYHTTKTNAVLITTEGVRVLVLFVLPAEWSFLPPDFLRADVLFCPGAPYTLPGGIQVALPANGEVNAERLAQLGVTAVSGGSLRAEGGKINVY
ncbi:MAG: ComEC/Rec2 family competence protein [Oscillospiraceae bacterium]|jgi:competence protein ComEC|nr:ComEC/Rec2 family competence protein [Oscillospiraceae bacterium]